MMKNGMTHLAQPISLLSANGQFRREMLQTHMHGDYSCGGWDGGQGQDYPLPVPFSSTFILVASVEEQLDTF